MPAKAEKIFTSTEMYTTSQMTIQPRRKQKNHKIFQRVHQINDQLCACNCVRKEITYIKQFMNVLYNRHFNDFGLHSIFIALHSTQQ